MSDEEDGTSESTQQPQSIPEIPTTELVTHWVTDSMDPSLIAKKSNNEKDD
jgi:hypothetical protein